MQFTDFAALQTPSPDRQAFLDVIREALDAALEQDHQQIQAVLTYARVQANGLTDQPTVGRQLSLPTSSADAGQVADAILDSFLNRAPGEGFIGQIRVEFLAEDEENTYALGVYERLVQIGEPNHQLPGGRFAGHLPPPAPGMFPSHNHDPRRWGGAPGYPTMDPQFGHGPVPQMDEITEEQHGMLLATNAANERRLDMILRQNQFMVERFMEVNGHYLQTQGYVMQLASHYMNRYQPPSAPAATSTDNPLAAVIGGLLAMFLGGQSSEPAQPPYQPPTEPMVPPLPLHTGMDPMEDAFHAPTEDLDPADITMEDAQTWARANPQDAKKIARDLLPPALQKLIPK